MKSKIFLLTLFAALCGVCEADNGDPNQNSATTQTPSTEQVAVPKDTIYKNGKMKVKRSRLHRFDREIQKTVFVPKGTWLCGASISDASKDYKNLNTLLVKDIDADGYSFGVTPIVGYFVANNVAVGARFAYNRSKIDLRNFDLNLGSNFNIKLKDYYYLDHDFQVIGFARTYMSLGGSKVFGFFSEMRAAYGRSQAKMTTGQYGPHSLRASLDGGRGATRSAGLQLQVDRPGHQPGRDRLREKLLRQVPDRFVLNKHRFNHIFLIHDYA